jgi:hypothetical protein
MWEHKASPQLREVLRKLESRFGSHLHLLPSESQWLTFQVIGMTDEVLIRTLEREHVAFFGPHVKHHRIVKDLMSTQPGVSISHHSGLSADSGFWYY